MAAGPANYFELKRDQLHAEWVKLDRQKPFAWILLVVSGVLFVSNYLGVNELTNQVLGGLTLMGVVAGGIWLWNIRKESDRISCLSMENNKELDRRD